jgi:hypothetical protein
MRIDPNAMCERAIVIPGNRIGGFVAEPEEYRVVGACRFAIGKPVREVEVARAIVDNRLFHFLPIYGYGFQTVRCDRGVDDHTGGAGLTLSSLSSDDMQLKV